ncbi:hypothetical protein [Streptomyces sp. SID3343]|uniref:hypothetical protein n=1 Tax=Streptomyces sp. SID3343 TaxID=2690260 RepID=UPI00136D96BB|nr:hypothetical protein [Streptomyces sp. SID3343]MYW06659.1 hypothetical protein [Streptomyces sp. SID3343]
MSPRTTARHLADELENRRREQPVGNALLSMLANGDLTREHLRRLIGTDAQCRRTELVAYATLVARFPHRPAADLYLTLARLVYDAGPGLATCAHALGPDPADTPPQPRERTTYAFNGVLSWLAIQGSQAATALAVHSDLIAYLGGCAELVSHLRSADLEVPDEFLNHYGAGAPEDLCRSALDVVQDGLDRGDDPDEAILAARLLEEGIGDFWRSAAGSAAIGRTAGG